jgi:hypothetical protein
MLCFTVAVAALLGLAQARSALEKPNIVMLFVDGQASCRARLSFYSLSSALPLHPLSLFCHFLYLSPATAQHPRCAIWFSDYHTQAC